MVKEIRNQKILKKDFLKSILFLFVVYFCAYFFKLFLYSYSLDTEFFMVHTKAMLDSWIAIGRFSLVFLKEITKFIPFHILLINWLTLLTFFLGSCFCYWNLARESSKLKEKKAMIMFLCIFGTSPIFLEQFNFTLQSLEIAISFCIFQCGISCFLSFLKKKTYFLFFLSILFIAFAMGAYQAFVTMYITEMILIFYIKLDQAEFKKKKKMLSFIGVSILFFFLSFLLYFLFSKFILQRMGVESSNYLLGQIGWLQHDFFTTIKNILKSSLRVYFGYVKNAYQFTPLNSFVCFFTMYLSWQKFRKKEYLKAINLLAILLCPLFMTFALGNSEPIRAYLTLPLVLSFLLTYERIEKKWYDIVIVIGVILQLSVMWMYEYCDYQRFVNDVTMAEEIYGRVEEYLDGRALVFVGAKDSNLKEGRIKGEALGISFFNHYGLSDRASTFLKSLGYSLNEDKSYILEATSMMKGKKSYPDEESILVTKEHVIVKLS